MAKPDLPLISSDGIIKPGDRVNVTLLDTQPLQTERIYIIDPQVDRISAGTQIDDFTCVSDKSPFALFSLGQILGFEGPLKLPAGIKRAKITDVAHEYRLE